MSTISTRGVIFNNADTRASFQNHCRISFYFGQVPCHYSVKEFFVTYNRSYLILKSAKLYPTHCKIPKIFKDDRTLIVASDLLELMKIIVPSTNSKIRYAKILQRLTIIMNNNPPPRVNTNAPQRVAQKASLLNDTTSPWVIKNTRHVHQQVTQSNTPMPTIM